MTTVTNSAAPDTAGDVDRKRIDLDANRKARREKQGPPPVIVFFGEEFTLPRSLPAEVIDLVGAVQAGDYTAVTKAMRVLLGGPVYEQVEAKAKAEGDPLELEDVTFLLERALEVYEVTLPESKASGSQS